MVFYSLEKDDRYADVWYNDAVEHFDSIVCPKFAGHQRGVRNENVPLSIVIKKKKIGDFVSTVYSDWLISDNVVELFKNHGLTGYKLRKVDVSNKILSINLWEICVIGEAAPHSDSGIKEIYRCDYCGSTKNKSYNDSTGIIIDESSWGGSDFFRIEAYPKYIFITEKVKRIIEDNQLNGVLFVPSTELCYPDYLATKYDQDWTKEQWKEYFEEDATPLQEELERTTREAWERIGIDPKTMLPVD